MKKLYTFCFAAILFSCQFSIAQDTLLYESFENEPEAYIIPTFASGSDTGWINYDADGYNDASGSDRPGEWFWSYGFADVDSNDLVYMSNSWTSPADQVSNYLILPPIDIVDNTAMLSWSSAPRQTPRYVDGYFVVISTDCNVEECFTDTLFRAAEYLSNTSLEEDSGFINYIFSPGFVHGEDGTYIEYHADSARFIGILQPQLVSLAAYAGQTVYIAFVHGSTDDNLISIDDILVTGTEISGISNVQDKQQMMIYPNPVSSVATIQFNLEKTSSVTTNVYDITGKLMKSQYSGMMIKGNQQLTLDVSDLAKGNYDVVIHSGKNVIVGKLTVQ